MRRGYGVRMKRRLRIFALAAVCAGVVVLSGCAPAEEPTPTPTAAFASDEEAFAAAEETYRAYVDALNEARDGSDVDPLAFLVGDALTDSIEIVSLLRENEQTITGKTEVVSFSGERVAEGKTVGHVCIDVGDTRVLTLDGTDQTPDDRPERAMLEVSFLKVDGQMRIGSSEAVELSC